MLRVGLTGGIGAGKSSVARRLTELGAVLADGDVLARGVLEPGSDGLADVVAQFGQGMLAPDGSLDRAALAGVVFADADARARLEAITHPRIAARAEQIIAGAGDRGIGVYDMPLLVEKGATAQFHLTIVVMADEDVRVARLVEHRGFAEEDARARVRAQVDDEARLDAADVVLRNDGLPGHLADAADRLWHERLVPFAQHLADATIPPGQPTGPGGAGEGGLAVRRAADRAAARVRRALHRSSIPVLADAVRVDAVPDVHVALTVTVPDVTAADLVAPSLAGAGFPRDPRPSSHPGTPGDARVHGSADPGQAVRLVLHPAAN